MELPMRLPDAAYTSRPWRIHELTRDFRLEDVIHEADSGMPIGDSGFFYLPDGVRVELGYRLKRSHWGRGLATEVAAKWLSVAMDWFGFTEVYAFAHAKNVVSLHIMKKLSFRYSTIERLYGMDAPLYKLTL